MEQSSTRLEPPRGKNKSKAHIREQVAMFLEVMQRKALVRIESMCEWSGWWGLLRPWLKLLRWVGMGGVWGGSIYFKSGDVRPDLPEARSGDLQRSDAEWHSGVRVILCQCRTSGGTEGDERWKTTGRNCQLIECQFGSHRWMSMAWWQSISTFANHTHPAPSHINAALLPSCNHRHAWQKNTVGR